MQQQEYDGSAWLVGRVELTGRGWEVALYLLPSPGDDPAQHLRQFHGRFSCAQLAQQHLQRLLAAQRARRSRDRRADWMAVPRERSRFHYSELLQSRYCPEGPVSPGELRGACGLLCPRQHPGAAGG